MRYYIADCHFWHTAMLTRMDNRPFETVEEMNAYMIKQWNSRVRKNDDVVILGDFCYAGAYEANEILRQLNGKHLWLVTGNHDQIFLRNKKFDRRRFVQIAPYLELHDNGRNVICCHYPIMEYDKMFHLNDNDDNMKTYMLHGHIHDSISNDYIQEYKKIVENIDHPVRHKGSNEEFMIKAHANIINCFCMYSEYIPLDLDEWIELDKKKTEMYKKQQHQ